MVSTSHADRCSVAKAAVARPETISVAEEEAAAAVAAAVAASVVAAAADRRTTIVPGATTKEAASVSKADVTSTVVTIEMAVDKGTLVLDLVMVILMHDLVRMCLMNSVIPQIMIIGVHKTAGDTEISPVVMVKGAAIVVASNATTAKATTGNVMVEMSDMVTTIVAAMTEEIIGTLIRINRLDQFWVSLGGFFLFFNGTVKGIPYFKLIPMHGFECHVNFVDRYASLAMHF